MHVLSKGDKVRVKQDGGKRGPTLWQVTETFLSSMIVMIAEIKADGTLYKAQPFDASLLALEPDNAKLQAAWNDSMTRITRR